MKDFTCFSTGLSLDSYKSDVAESERRFASAMAQVLYSVTVSLSTRQLSKHRPPLFSKHATRVTNTAATNNKPYGVLFTSAQGTAQGQHSKARCHSYQDQHAVILGPDISQLEPAVREQWDHTANAYLGRVLIKPHSNKKVQWKCDQCPDGHPHSWSAPVYTRTHGSECPQCTGRQVCKHNSLATKAPEVAAQWDYTANSTTPDIVVAHSSKKFGWVCGDCAYQWNARVIKRVQMRQGCPRCAVAARTNRSHTQHPTFAGCQHPLLAEWDHEQNAAQGNPPEKVKLKSRKQIFWLCTKWPAGQQHSWSATAASRTGPTKPGCPCCAGLIACKCNSLQTLYPDIAAEWDYSKNTGQPSDYPASSHRLAWWCTPQRGSWQQLISSRTSVVYQKAARLRRIQQMRNPEK